MDALNIGELAHQVGLRTSAIRFYESVGLLPKPPRRSGWRRYDPSILARLQVIQAAREVGFFYRRDPHPVGWFSERRGAFQALAADGQAKIA